MVFGKHWTRKTAIFVTSGKDETQCRRVKGVFFASTSPDRGQSLG